jgi:hypothetical protein
MSKGLQLLTAFLFISSLSGVAQPPRESGFRAHGTVESAKVLPNGAEVTGGSYGFSIEVVGERWHLETPYERGKKEEYFCDGTNVVALFYDPECLAYPVPATVQNDGFPAGGFQADLPWLAYASAKYLNQNKQLAAPWATARHDVRAWTYDATICRFRVPPELPSEIVFVQTASNAKSAINNPALKIEGVDKKALRQRKLLAQQAQHSQKEGRYSVTGTTNLDGLLIPLSFQVAVYSPGALRDASRTNALRPNFIYRGKASGVLAINEGLAWPQLNQRSASVTDRRFRSERHHIDCIQYFVTNGNWFVRTNHPYLVGLFEAKRRSAPFLRLSDVEEVLFMAAVAFVAVFPAIVWWIRRRRPPQESTRHS